MPSDIEIAQAYADRMKPIIDLAGVRYNIPPRDLDPSAGLPRAPHAGW